MTELKPCPFCGGGTHYYAPAPIDHHIQCEKCFAETGGFSSKEAAIEAWNTRAEREIGISKFQKITGASYIEAKSILTSLEQAGAKVVE